VHERTTVTMQGACNAQSDLLEAIFRARLSNAHMRAASALPPATPRAPKHSLAIHAAPPYLPDSG
jgi:hypothetical protein